jgi:uncharacterized OB-fold protein
MTAETIPYPKPTATPVSQYFWDQAANHNLTYQRCQRCRRGIFPPRAHCPHCWHTTLEWCTSAGAGELASRTVVHRPGHPAFRPDSPYTLVLVDLDEGFRMLSELVGPHRHDAPVGNPVQVCWTRRGDHTLPLFTLSQAEL